MRAATGILSIQKTKHTDSITNSDNDASPPVERAREIAVEILAKVMAFRRSSGASCASSPCGVCLEPHLHQVTTAVLQSQPVTFVLPAFPGKSPNPAKVLGVMPDMAERRSLEFLHQLCNQIRTTYEPGAKVLLCSDGRVFSDVVGMRDCDVTEYQREISHIIEQMSLTTISIFNLDLVYEHSGFDQMRCQLMKEHGETLDTVKEKVLQGGKPNCGAEAEEANRQYRGIIRFLVEDAMGPTQTQSRTALQKACRARAYELIRRSRAWSDLLAARFPDSVRLSIHPQTCGSAKLGIRLLEGESWMTPWHGVAVKVGDGFVLLKRFEAEKLGARLITSSGRPSHYELDDAHGLTDLRGALRGI